MKTNCGSYQIINRKNLKRYIGVAGNLRSREISHFSAMKKNKHQNKKLQKDFNRYGKCNFIFQIIEYCEKSEIDRMFLLERDIIKFINPKKLYNINLHRGGGPLKSYIPYSDDLRT